jgi:apolipoprotein D and lipocalin family protein
MRSVRSSHTERARKRDRYALQSGQTTEKRVDLSRYAGKWYEIAAFPAWFERGCRCSTASYIHMDEYVEVKNSCVLDNGETAVASGKAFPVPDTDNTQLRVRFIWPFKSEYWIIALDDDYQYAMVGHPQKKYLWIMSRTPSMDEAVYQSLVEKALSQGYDVEKLQRMDQSCPI